MANLSVDFKKMVELLLNERPEIDAEHIKEMIDEKKRKVGAGYLTDQGALFLVAADLGVSFENIPKLEFRNQEIVISVQKNNYDWLAL